MSRSAWIEADRFRGLGEWLTRRHASPLDPYLEWLRRPAAVLALAATAAVLCGLYLHPRALILAAGLAGVLAVGLAWPWLAVRGLAAELSFDRPRVQEGRPAKARLVVRCRTPWGAWGLVVRCATVDSSGVLAGLDHAPGWGSTAATWEFVPDRRGEYPGDVPRIGTAFPFGIREAARPLAVATPLLVWPATFPVGPIPDAAGGRESEGASVRKRAGTSGDLLGVRPYRRGDSLRRVHWPQSARHDSLIVCELESRATPRVQVVVDVDPRAHAGSGPDGSLEWAVRVAASFAEDWIDRGADVELVHGGRRVAASGSAATRRAAVLDSLARLQADPDAALGDVLDGPACRGFDGGVRVVVATDRSASGGTRGRARHERFVLLHADAFDGEGAGRVSRAPDVRPWIWIDDPADVPGQVRRGCKEN